jgi:hypothetical protein
MCGITLIVKVIDKDVVQLEFEGEIKGSRHPFIKFVAPILKESRGNRM